MKTLNRFAVLLAAFLFSFASASAEQVVFDAQPDSRITSSVDSSTRTVLGKEKRNEFRLLITKVGKDYFWTSREDRPLVYTMSGAFHIFSDLRGAGYIKIFDTLSLPESLREPGPRFQYMEHVTLWLGSITYWGSSNKLELGLRNK